MTLAPRAVPGLQRRVDHRILGYHPKRAELACAHDALLSQEYVPKRDKPEHRARARSRKCGI